MVGFLPSFSPSNFRAQGVRLNGSTQYFSKAAALSGAADGSEGTFSMWVKMLNDSNALQRGYLYGRQSSPVCFCATGNMFSGSVDAFQTNVLLSKSSGSTICNASSSTDVKADGSWHHLIVSYKTAEIRWYTDGVLDGHLTSVPLSGTIPYSTIDKWYVGFIPGSPDSYTFMEIAEVWFHTSWIDLTVAANLQCFRTAAGKPADLGNQGQVNPLGTQPLIYLSGGASTFGNNKGSGGSFNPINSPTDSTTSPSD